MPAFDDCHGGFPNTKEHSIVREDEN
jgi:hypothetical protein